MSVTPNMGLVAPGVGSTPGPDYALQINSDFTTIDQHDHTPGKGILIPVSGLNINDNLSLNNHKLTDVLNLNFTDQASNSGINDYYSLYTVNGNLYFNDTLLNKIQITKNGAVNATLTKLENVVGPDTYGAAFSNNVLVVSQTAGTLTGRKQPIAVSEVQLSGTSTVYQLTLLSPTLLGSYSITLPNVSPDAAGSLVSISTSGVMSPMSYNTAAGLIGQTGADLIAKQFSNNTTPPPPSGNGYLGLTAIANNMSSNNAAILVAKIATADTAPINYRNPAGDAVATAITTSGANVLVGKTDGSLIMPSSSANVIVNSITSAVSQSSADIIGARMTSTGANAVAATRTRTLSTNGNQPSLPTSANAGQVVYSYASSGQVANSTTNFNLVANQYLRIYSSGRPIVIQVIANDSSSEAYVGGYLYGGGSSVNVAYEFARLNINTFAKTGSISLSNIEADNTYPFYFLPPSILTTIDTSPITNGAGVYAYGLYFRGQSSINNAAIVKNIRLIAYEI